MKLKFVIDLHSKLAKNFIQGPIKAWVKRPDSKNVARALIALEIEFDWEDINEPSPGSLINLVSK